MKRILVIRGGAIGDFVLTLPAIKLLRDEFPHAQLEILGYKHIIALAEKRFYADAVRSIEYGALASFFAKDAELPGAPADYFASFDLIVSYLFDPDEIFTRNLRLCGVETLLQCPHTVDTDGEHAALQLARPLAELDLTIKEPAATLYPSEQDCAFADHFVRMHSRHLVAIHPGSGSASKTWAAENWKELGSWLLSEKLANSLLIIGGEADKPALAQLKVAWQQNSVLFTEDLALPHLAAVLQKCTLFLGHDSGISHIAAAVGTPCLLLFGPTDPEIWAPRNVTVKIVQGATAKMSAISMTSVTEQAQTLLADQRGAATARS